MSPNRRAVASSSSFADELEPAPGEELLPFALHQVIGAATLDSELRQALLRGDRDVIDTIPGLTPRERRTMRRVGTADSLPEWALTLEALWGANARRAK